MNRPDWYFPSGRFCDIMAFLNKNNEGKLEKRFLEAYDAYAERILRHASFRVNDTKIAEDITSETFMKAWDYVRKNNEVKNFKGFFYRIVDNLITDYYRSKKYQPVPIETVDEANLADKTDLSAETERGMLLETVNTHLQSLPAEYRVILIYRYIDELDILTIRKLTGKSLTNVYVTIHRALKCLKEKIKKTNED
jgi:RNA polymerase sigma-70 factor (ECF subfamily)